MYARENKHQFCPPGKVMKSLKLDEIGWPKESTLCIPEDLTDNKDAAKQSACMLGIILHCYSIVRIYGMPHQKTKLP